MPTLISKSVLNADPRRPENIARLRNQMPPPEQISQDDTFSSPQDWPAGIIYLSLPTVSPWLTEKQQKWLCRKPENQHRDLDVSSTDARDILPIIRLPQSRQALNSQVTARRIDNNQHPAHGQFGLFAARDMGPGELILPYIGYVHSSTISERSVCDAKRKSKIHDGLLDCVGSQTEVLPWSSVSPSDDTDLQVTIPTQVEIGSWDTSSYDLNLFRDGDIELAVDAGFLGNEARFCNDYRGVPKTHSQMAAQSNPNWERRSKRSARSWTDQGATSNQDYIEKANYDKSSSIPNAEFRDVWFEWSLDDGKNLQERKLSLTDTTLDPVVREHIPNIQEITSTARSHDHVQNKSHGQSGDSKAKIEKSAKKTQRRRNKTGMRGVAIFVLPAGKSGKRQGGIMFGQEILVSYGKGFWAHHGV